MSIDNRSIRLLLDLLTSRTHDGSVRWEPIDGSGADVYTTSFSRGSVLLQDLPFGSVSLRILDEGGSEVFSESSGGAFESGDGIVKQKIQELFRAVQATDSRRQHVIDALLSELGP